MVEESLPGGFFEGVVDRTIDPKTHTTLLPVRFSGYGQEEDMWLPSSAMAEQFTFQSTLSRGRTRTHCAARLGSVDPFHTENCDSAKSVLSKQKREHLLGGPQAKRRSAGSVRKHKATLKARVGSRGQES